MKNIVALSALTALLIIAPIAAAQESRATISGTVLDPSGAAIPNVRITLTEIRTGVKTSATSDSVGNYNIPFLPPGEYEIQAEVAGFKSFVRKGIRLCLERSPGARSQDGDRAGVGVGDGRRRGAAAGNRQCLDRPEHFDRADRGLPAERAQPDDAGAAGDRSHCDRQSQHSDQPLRQRRGFGLEHRRHRFADQRDHDRWRAERHLGQSRGLLPAAGSGAGSQGEGV